MSRRKKRSRPSRARPGPSARQEPPRAARAAESPGPRSQRPAPEPTPPRPNKLLLIVTSILLIAWIAALIWLAVTA